ncbi:periplasmic binding protein-like II [Anaeromyces robustus]|uniref:Periplasmic binding protein-like II n=1 Tax=Anaeromyces robustus TaxID=1754192 RepID=A0A1Y1XH43_9FUNG|nr:periplasmic binding protein-like II [Anaeromyces robustus]|eukprot:ORX85081.1 periplasmic binding protein-like II [Anaeromyces robustus]
MAKIIEKIILFGIIAFYFIFIKKVKSIIVNGLAFAPLAQTELYSYIANEFNEYSERNNLNITFNINLFTSNNSTANTDDFYSVTDSFFKKKSQKYDIYFYNNVYTPSFESYLLDLNKLLPENHINMYKNIEEYKYSYNNKLVGMPFFINYSVMYNNVQLLEKYGRQIPNTWNELLETGIYILEKEKKNNDEIIIYNGAFVDDEIGMGSIYEFFYSYRDDINAKTVDLTSKNTLDALIMMKKLKNELSSDHIYSNLDIIVQTLIDGNGLFIKTSLMDIPVNKSYKITTIPGNKKGISGTITGGYNVGLNGYIKEEKIEPSREVLMYITSKDVQKKIITDRHRFSGISSLYNEKEVCDKVNICEIYKKLQFVERPLTLTNNYSGYSGIFRYYIYKYLYGDDDMNPAEILKKIDDLTKYYYISPKLKDSNIGIFIFIIYGILSFIIIFSSIFLFIDKFDSYFSFLSKDFWILSLIGYVLILYISYLDLGKVTILKCYLKLLFQYLSFTFIFIPIFCRLISNYPEVNKFSEWINNHQYIFVVTFIIIDLLISGLISNSFSINNIINHDSKNFQTCKINGIFSNILIIATALFKLMIILFSLFLIFLEWFLKITYNDVRLCTAAYYISILLIILLTIFDNINIRNYNVYFTIRELTIIIFVITNYILLYGIRIMIIMNNNKNNKDYYIEKTTQSSIEEISSSLKRFSTTSEISSVNNSSSSSSKDSYPLLIKLLNYHYRNEIISTKYKNKLPVIGNKIRNNGVQSSVNYRSNNMIYNKRTYSSVDYNEKILLSKNYKNENQIKDNKLNDRMATAIECDIPKPKNILIEKNKDISETNNSLSNVDFYITESKDALLPNKKITFESKHSILDNNGDISESRNILLKHNDIPESIDISIIDNNNNNNKSKNNIEKINTLMKNQKDITDN